MPTAMPTPMPTSTPTTTPTPTPTTTAININVDLHYFTFSGAGLQVKMHCPGTCRTPTAGAARKPSSAAAAAASLSRFRSLGCVKLPLHGLADTGRPDECVAVVAHLGHPARDKRRAAGTVGYPISMQSHPRPVSTHPRGLQVQGLARPFSLAATAPYSNTPGPRCHLRGQESGQARTRWLQDRPQWDIPRRNTCGNQSQSRGARSDRRQHYD
jgi:hypothetical protein